VIVDALPVVGADKIDKKTLRAEQWYGDNPIWWRPGRDLTYNRWTADDIALLEAGFARHDRASMLAAR
jgi:fatty-acyl-CoA synthase